MYRPTEVPNVVMIKELDRALYWDRGFGYLSGSFPCVYCKELVPPGCLVFYNKHIDGPEESNYPLLISCKDCFPRMTFFPSSASEGLLCRPEAGCEVWHLTKDLYLPPQEDDQ